VGELLSGDVTGTVSADFIGGDSNVFHQYIHLTRTPINQNLRHEWLFKPGFCSENDARQA
jgi:hypothetical protein